MLLSDPGGSDSGELLISFYGYKESRISFQRTVNLHVDGSAPPWPCAGDGFSCAQEAVVELRGPSGLTLALPWQWPLWVHVLLDAPDGVLQT
jgi:hypothetical protein